DYYCAANYGSGSSWHSVF
nr:immunoglobulin light chain junction region [Macaca mulatta]MOW15390.1 immunoglobulin light chain junction region [Macaca mulatta]MOW15459.1 immunoglobulin light chain junction region [Macaca mulatta]MOW15660.1 immunoglobulin light chain junction region [Macaca mulatta]MOW15682.1 immunoglobulin light chain junction region [Macaca mulatta]